MYLIMFAAVIIAVWLDRVRVRPLPWRAGAAVVTAAALVPLVPAAMIPYEMRTPGFFTGDQVRQIPDGATALVLPYPRPDQTSAMLWQAESGFRFQMPGCYCTVPGPDGTATFHGPGNALTTAVIQVEQGLTTARAALAAPGVREAYRQLDPGAVILGPAENRAELSALVTDLTGLGPRDMDGVQVWLPVE
jgi:hypothetical protein